MTQQTKANVQFPVAGVQLDIMLGQPKSNLNSIAKWLGDARTQSARLVVFPECAISGYCFESKAEAMQIAEPISGPSMSQLVQLSAQHSKYIACGMLEKSGDDLFNSSVLVGPAGVVGVYRKIHLPFLGVDRFVTSSLEPQQVFEIGGIRVGMHICYDGSFPEATRVLALLGADLVILPTNWPPGADTFAEYIPHARALENHIYFMAVNRVGEERGFQFIGNSKFCLPTGRAPSSLGTEEGVVGGTVQPHITRNKRLVRVPGKHLIDRFADRRPQQYSLITQAHNLVRDESEN